MHYCALLLWLALVVPGSARWFVALVIQCFVASLRGGVRGLALCFFCALFLLVEVL